MDEKIETSFIADDIKSESSHSEKGKRVLKEKSELIFEIETICNKDALVSELLKSEPLAEQDYSKKPENGCIMNSFFMDTSNTNIQIQSKPNMCKKDFKGTIDQSETLDKEQEMNVFPPKQIAKITGFRDVDHNSDENPFQRTVLACDKTTVIDQESKVLLLKPTAEIFNNKDSDDNSCSYKSQEKGFIPLEGQQIVDSSESNMLDDSKRYSRRNSKRKKDSDGCCPICGVTVRYNDLESHYNQEVERLSKISRCSKKVHLEEAPRNEAFDLVRKNRENRLTARVARYTARAKNEVKCPVCSLRMSGTAEEINKHVAFCIQEEDSDVDVDGDDDGTESFEEYEIGDETRIRPISLVPGGYRSLHGDSVRQTAEDEDLNVDIDDTIAYGDPQYSEIDVIPNTSSEKDRMDLEQLRKAVAVDSSVRPQTLECHKWSKAGTEAENPESSSKSMLDSDPVVSSLKEKIKALEDQDKSVRCLICLDPYTKPVVSTTCWHVHCEECWLMTMGVKKLCPQCNMIVFPSDLRKIYL